MCSVLHKMCDIELKTECKATIVLAILQTWFRDLVHEFQLLVIAFQIPILVCKQLGKSVIEGDKKIGFESKPLVVK